jgi:GNAT superfamily N-acetyltransferase
VVGPPAGASGADIRIRDIRRSDRDSFSEVLLGSYAEFETMLGLGKRGAAEFADLFRPGIWFVLRTMRLFGLAPFRLFVAADGPTVVGTTMLLPWPVSGYILAVGVRASHRRRGLAGRLVGRAEEVAARHGRTWAVLDVEEENHPAFALYRARGYETIQSAVWLQCLSPRAVASAPRAGGTVRVVGKAGRKSAAAWCAQHAPPSITAILPPTPARLSHFESLGQFPGVAWETWSAGPSDSPVGYLSAAWRGTGMPGILFLPAVAPAASHDGFAHLVQEGTAWLVGRGSPAVVVAVPSWMRSFTPVLEELGFVVHLTTLTMARRLDGPGRSAGPPKGP